MKTKIFLLFIAAAFTACKGDKGEVGTPGTPGTNGNANVHTEIFSVASSDWISNGNTWTCTLFAPDITSDIASNGTVQVQIESTNTTGLWIEMPYTITFSGWYYEYNFNYTVSTVHVLFQNSDTFLPANPGVQKFKVVAIAGQ